MTEVVPSNALEVFSSAIADKATGFDPVVVRIGINHLDAEFKYPGLKGSKRIDGIFLSSRKARCFFPKMLNDADTAKISQVTSNRPLCSSTDCITGEIRVEKESFEGLAPEHPALFLKNKLAEGALHCAKCPFGQWESVQILGVEGRGQACKELRRLLYWQLGLVIPVILSVPSSSIKAWDGYCSSLGAANMRHNTVVTEVSLQTKEYLDRKWSVMDFSFVSGITEEQAIELIANVEVDGVSTPLYQNLIDIFEGREIEEGDYPVENGTATSAGDDL